MRASLTAFVLGVGILGSARVAAAQPGATGSQPGMTGLQWGMTGSPPGMTDATPVQPKHVDGRDTDRIQVAAGMAMFASYPMSIEDPGPFAMIGTPLWLGKRYRFFQWALDADVAAGFGTYTGSLHVAVAPKFGMNLYFGPVFGLEFRMGPAGIVQVGDNTVAGVGGMTSSSYVFRFWDDDRKRIKLLVHMHFGGYFADDPGNDLGTNAAGMGMAVAYETPL